MDKIVQQDPLQVSRTLLDLTGRDFLPDTILQSQ